MQSKSKITRHWLRLRAALFKEKHVVMSQKTSDSWELEDPATFEGTDEEILAKFREIRDQIMECVKGFMVQESKSG